jgi:putative membrane protein
MSVLSTVLAGMGGNGNNHHDMDASDWLWMSLMWLLALAVIALVVWLVVWAVQRQGAGGTRSARDILNERYARGEIEHDEYEERLSKLR